MKDDATRQFADPLEQIHVRVQTAILAAIFTINNAVYIKQYAVYIKHSVVHNILSVAGIVERQIFKYSTLNNVLSENHRATEHRARWRRRRRRCYSRRCRRGQTRRVKTSALSGTESMGWMLGIGLAISCVAIIVFMLYAAVVFYRFTARRVSVARLKCKTSVYNTNRW